MSFFSSNIEAIGNTPLVRIRRMVGDLPVSLLAKIEGRNPAYSVKCRIGAAMILAAEQSGALKPGIRVVEATSGNTGIALAFACASRGYQLTLTMPDTMSSERLLMLRIFGAQVILTPGNEGMAGAIQKAESIASVESVFRPRQFENPANPEIHYRTTGPEILRDTEGNVDVLVCGVGTGGTITGVGRFLKEFCHRNVHVVAVEPAASPVLSGGTPGRHRIPGIGAGFIPSILDRSVVDEVITVSDESALDHARRLMLEEGISCGVSCGAAIAAALELAARPVFRNATIVTVLPDAAERYLSTDLFKPFTAARTDRIYTDVYPYTLGDD